MKLAIKVLESIKQTPQFKATVSDSLSKMAQWITQSFPYCITKAKLSLSPHCSSTQHSIKGFANREKYNYSPVVQASTVLLSHIQEKMQ